MPASEPVVPGHAVVASRRHVNLFYDLDVEEQRRVWEVVTAVKSRISEGLKVDHFHIGFADFPNGSRHAHVHVIPRGSGDDFDLPANVEWVEA